VAKSTQLPGAFGARQDPTTAALKNLDVSDAVHAPQRDFAQIEAAGLGDFAQPPRVSPVSEGDGAEGGEAFHVQ